MRGDHRRTFSDQTGIFPKSSIKGSKYIMMIYNANNNTILAGQLKPQAKHKLLRAITKMHEYLTTKGLQLSIQILNNKEPELIK